jgi:hypothetical protein
MNIVLGRVSYPPYVVYEGITEEKLWKSGSEWVIKGLQWVMGGSKLLVVGQGR